MRKWMWFLVVMGLLLGTSPALADDGSDSVKDLNPIDLAQELDEIARTPEGGMKSNLGFATCSGTGCNGTDPGQTGCSADGRTVAYTNIVNSSGTAVGRVELRWSPTCQTNWSRVTRWDSNSLYQYAYAFLSPNANGDPKYYPDGGYVPVNGTWWSYQVYAPTTPWRGCGMLAIGPNTDVGSNIGCTILR